ncbi:hypothetical protein Lal_00039252, partial [Lupinus albus]
MVTHLEKLGGEKATMEVGGDEGRCGSFAEQRSLHNLSDFDSSNVANFGSSNVASFDSSNVATLAQVVAVTQWMLMEKSTSRVFTLSYVAMTDLLYVALYSLTTMTDLPFVVLYSLTTKIDLHYVVLYSLTAMTDLPYV